jgi:hypothetical protein
MNTQNDMVRTALAPRGEEPTSAYAWASSPLGDPIDSAGELPYRQNFPLDPITPAKPKSINKTMVAAGLIGVIGAGTALGIALLSGGSPQPQHVAVTSGATGAPAAVPASVAPAPAPAAAAPAPVVPPPDATPPGPAPAAVVALPDATPQGPAPAAVVASPPDNPPPPADPGIPPAAAPPGPVVIVNAPLPPPVWVPVPPPQLPPPPSLPPLPSPPKLPPPPSLPKLPPPPPPFLCLPPHHLAQGVCK